MKGHHNTLKGEEKHISQLEKKAEAGGNRHRQASKGPGYRCTSASRLMS